MIVNSSLITQFYQIYCNNFHIYTIQYMSIWLYLNDTQLHPDHHHGSKAFWRCAPKVTISGFYQPFLNGRSMGVLASQQFWCILHEFP